MRLRCWAGAGAAVVAVTFPQPALAHQGHARCAEGAHATVVFFAHGGEAGDTASALARAGGFKEGVADAHATLCGAHP